MGIGMIVEYAWFSCTWMGESGTFMEALGGFWGIHTCAETGIKRGGVVR